MRRVVTALVLVMVAGTLAACSSPAATTDTSGSTAGTPAPVVAAPPAAASSTATGNDILSPTEVVSEGEMFPTDPTSVPKAVLDNLSASKPMLVYFYDPTTKVSGDQRKQIDSAIKKYRGTIELMTFNYTVGLATPSAGTTLPAEVNKAELMTGLLKVHTTPYIIFVDRYGRITYRFAGYVDHKLLEREVLRATE